MSALRRPSTYRAFFQPGCVRQEVLQKDKIEAMLKNAKERDENKVTRFSERTNAVNSDLDFYSLAQNKADRHMDPFVIDIFPASEEEVKLSSHEGEEFIYVLEGKVEIQYGKDTYELEVGDSLYYDSIVAHHVHSHEGKAKILAVVYTPV